MNASSISAIYRATITGTGVTASTEPAEFAVADNDGNYETAHPTIVDSGVTWQVVPIAQWLFSQQTTQMIISGLDWILSTDNPGPHSYAIATLSTFRVIADTASGSVAGPSPSLEGSIRALLSNNITVIASANNQNGDACDTSPGRMSHDNLDSSVAGDVITAGGSMILNRPWTVDISALGPDAHEADGAGLVNPPPASIRGLEPAYDWTKGIRDARWICGAGDSSPCSNYPGPCTGDPTKCTKNPATNINAYYQFEAGSNAGRCVTLFAPAKNLFLATLAGSGEYRDARLRGANASGTSWSAPIVAGFAARILQQTPLYSPAQIRTALLANSTATLDTNTLNSYDYNGNEIAGTPNKFLRLGDVNITTQPSSIVEASSGTTQLHVDANGTSSVSYHWYEVNSDFDYATYRSGANSERSTSVGTNSSTFNAPASASRRAYWVRVTNSCGSADSDIAVVVPPPASPTSVNAVANGGNVTVTWLPGAGADQYEIQREVSGQPWIAAATVSSNLLSFTETPVAPGGMVLYRVISVAGVAYLSPSNLARSSPSNNDFANTNSGTYEAFPMPPAGITIKAQHLIELRQAVNALCDAAGVPALYVTSELQLAALQGHVVQAVDFTSLLAKINNIRTNSSVGAALASFIDTPVMNGPVKSQHLQSLRDALK